ELRPGKPVLYDKLLSHDLPTLDPVIVVDDGDHAAQDHSLAAGSPLRLNHRGDPILSDFANLGHPVGELDAPLADDSARQCIPGVSVIRLVADRQGHSSPGNHGQDKNGSGNPKNEPG